MTTGQAKCRGDCALPQPNLHAHPNRDRPRRVRACFAASPSLVSHSLSDKRVPGVRHRGLMGCAYDAERQATVLQTVSYCVSAALQLVPCPATVTAENARTNKCTDTLLLPPHP